jgi:hypothetical protein
MLLKILAMVPGHTTTINATVQADYEINQTTENPMNTTTVPIWSTTVPIPRGCPLDYDWCYG